MSPVTVGSVEEWAETCSSAFVPLRVRSAAGAFRARLDQRRLTPEVSLTRVTSGASEVYRSDQVIARHPQEDILVSLHRAGRGVVRQHDRAAELGAGGAALYDAAAPYVLSFPGPMSEVVLQLPRRALGLGDAQLAELASRPLPAGGPMRALNVLADSVLGDQANAGEGGPEEGAVADALVGLLTAAIATRPDAAAHVLDRPLLLRTLRRHIDDHLEDPRLTPSVVAQHHHISLRHLQHVFAEDDDSPAAYIRRGRLERARRRLVDGADVGSTAGRCGYLDVDSFSRAFKRAYGVPPSAVRGEMRSG